MIGNAHGIECFPRNGYRRNDVHPVVKNNPAFLVGTVTEFIDFIGRTHHSIQIIKEKGALCSPGCSTGFRAVNLCGDGIPGIHKTAEKAVVIPGVPASMSIMCFIQKGDLVKKRMPFYKHPFSDSILFLFLIILQSGLQEFDILRYIFVVGVRLIERLAFVVNQHIERLRIGTKLDALQITPLVAYGTQRTFPCRSPQSSREKEAVSCCRRKA